MGIEFDPSATAFSFYIKHLTFSGGSEVILDEGTMLIITGPNSSGKSVALKEIQAHLARLGTNDPSPQPPFYAVKNAQFRLHGTPAQFADRLQQHYPTAISHDGIRHFQVRHFVVSPRHPTFTFTPRSVGELNQVLAHRLDTQSRLTLAASTKSARYANGQLTAYIHYLQRDTQLANKISEILSSAFNHQLIINFGGGPDVWFHVGEKPMSNSEDDRVSAHYLEQLELQPKLDSEGDGIRSFTSTVLAAHVGSYPLLLIDEPEAFLHPPQSRKLGSILAHSLETSKRQIVVATHSSELIQGAMDTSQNVAVCRIIRDGDVNRVAVLGRSELRSLWSKPLLRSSVAMSGLFHSGVVACEADADCRFYEAIALREEKDSERPLDLYFVHGGGKGALPALAASYRTLSVPVAVIADLDLLRSKEEFNSLILALGGDLALIERLYVRVSSALNDRKPLVSAADFIKAVGAVLDRVKASEKITSPDRRRLQELLEEAADWSEVKRYGIDRLTGAELTVGKQLLELCKQAGLFLVPKGELERWWREGPADKTEWILQAIPKLGEEPSIFQEASDFVGEVCRYLK